MNIKTVDVQAKEWFDRVNGNSYFSTVVTVNYGMEDEKEIKIPMQYGYGDMYKHEAFYSLISEGLIKADRHKVSYWNYYRDNGIIARHSIQTKWLKRDVKAFVA